MKDNLIAVITGDIIHSRKGDVNVWLNVLKSVLIRLAGTKGSWDIFRGDSFQLSTHPQQALLAAYYIKSCIRQTGTHDVRMAIGIGENQHNASTISESQGSAFVRSGACFDNLKKRTLAFQSDQPEMDIPLNIMLDLATLTANHWSRTSALVIQTRIDYPEETQSALARRLQKSQSNISEALDRGGFEPLMKVNAYFQAQLEQICQSLS